MHASSFSFAAVFQYAFFAVVVYVLAGAPLQAVFTASESSAASARDGIAQEKLESLVIPDKNLSCAEHNYKGVYILSREPLVVYIEGFLSDEETEEVVRKRYVFITSTRFLILLPTPFTITPFPLITHLSNHKLRPTLSPPFSSPYFSPSTIWTAGRESLDTSIRHSEKAPLPRDDTVQCIERRAATFQGWRPYVFIEKLWAQRYRVGGHYTYHYDWSTASKRSGRVSSFMVYLHANCTGGGTHFPRLKKPRGAEWCKFIECDAKGSEKDAGLNEGVIFKPVQGNAVYWENMRSDGSGYAESWHAGLPVERGTKIGLNIWSWLQEGYVPPTSETER
jgi:prolyl 4-hydroxylase